jgi:hypothetical protein
MPGTLQKLVRHHTGAIHIFYRLTLSYFIYLFTHILIYFLTQHPRIFPNLASLIFFMHKLIIAAFLLCLLAPMATLAQFNRPPLDSVVTHFFAHYKYEGNYPKELRFASAPAGWFVYETDLTQPSRHYRSGTLLWSEDTRHYRELETFDINPDGDPARQAARRYLQYIIAGNGFTYSYSNCIYYGYDGWDEDIIQEWKDKTPLGDVYLEGLARAYSNYAGGFIYDQFGFMANRHSTHRTPVEAADSISSTRADSFAFYIQKAIDTYLRLHNQNKNYETIVGPVYDKYSNEHLYAWSTLLMAGHTAGAQRFIRPGLYTDSLLQRARNYLKPVSPGGIIFTYGDNDTYPLWYLQQKEGVKKEVRVINNSLLGMPRYLQLLHRQTGGQLFSTRPAVFLKEDFYYGGAYNSGASVATSKPLSIADFLREWQTGANRQSIETGNGNSISLRQFNQRKINFPINKQKAALVFKNKPLLPAMDIMLGNYVQANEFILLDILQQHFHKKPIYFTWRGPENYFNQYLSGEDLVFQLLPVGGSASNTPVKKKDKHDGHDHRGHKH